MLTRRQTLLGAAIGTTVPLGAARAASNEYDEAEKSIWRHSSEKPADTPALMRELVRYATLAPSSHNTQCWRFRIQERAILIEPPHAPHSGGRPRRPPPVGFPGLRRREPGPSSPGQWLEGRGAGN